MKKNIKLGVPLVTEIKIRNTNRKTQRSITFIQIKLKLPNIGALDSDSD